MNRLRLWHAALVGAFIVAFATGDEDTYTMHLVSGWLVVALLALRPVLAFKRPNRARIFAWSVTATLAAVAAAALSGVAADLVPFVEGLHEGLANLSLGVVLAHVAAAFAVYRGRRWLARWVPAALAVGLMVMASPLKAEPARDAILAAYAASAKAENPAFAGFSAACGEALYRSRNSVNPDAVSCSSCHTDDPTRPGRHVKTGRTIEPVAVSANPKRFTDAEKVEERFTRDCKSILGRVCTAQEKGDYVTFMASR
ncbi:MAG TPA: DUF1924 domain-containing protein [Magnetospirillum sp.]|jgi:cytochrome b561|nr:DUF1924 domain-containing protein [Magnetospirillum sp.]